MKGPLNVKFMKLPLLKICITSITTSMARRYAETCRSE